MRKFTGSVCLVALFAVCISMGFTAIAYGGASKTLIGSAPANPYQNPYEAVSYPEKLEIFRDGEQIGTIQSEKPNIERWGFIDSGDYVVVKSVGKTGPAILELFETATCKRVDKLMMSGEKNQLPAWATEFTK